MRKPFTIKRLLIRHQLLLLTLVCFVAGLLLLRAEKIGKNIGPDRQTIALNLMEKEQIAKHWIDTLCAQIENNHLNYFVNLNSTSIDKLFEQWGIVTYIYSGSKMVYWTRNTIAVPEDTIWYKTRFGQTGNAFMVLDYRRAGKMTVVGGILIKRNYPYENEFLLNHLHPSFNARPELDVFQGKSTDEDAVYSYKGDYLFSLRLAGHDNSMARRMIAFPLLLLSTLLLLMYVQQGIKRNRLSNRKFFIIAIIAFAGRIALQIFLPESFYQQMPIFTARYFAASVWFPSLGDLLITVIMVVYLIFIYYFKVHLQRLKRISGLRKYSIVIVWILMLMVYFLAMYYVFTRLIEDSSFQFEAYDVLNLSIFSFIGYFILVLCFIGFILLTDKASVQLFRAFGFGQIMGIFIPIYLTAAIFWYFYGTGFDIISVIFFAAIVIYWFQLRSRKNPGFFSMVIVIALFSAYATSYIRKENFDRRIEECKVMAVNLAQLQDPIAEVVISDLLPQIKKDTFLITQLRKPDFNFDVFYRYLQNQYFTGYLNRYNFQVTVCNAQDSVLVDADKNEWYHCYQFFNRMLRNNGSPTTVQGLYYLKDGLGGTNYFLKVLMALRQGYGYVTLFFELSPKTNYEVLGYPELLLEKPIKTNQYSQQISYAKYAGNRLLIHSGTFPYAFDRMVYGNALVEFSYFESDGYDHVIYNPNPENSIVVSAPTINAYNILISFTYIFIFFLVMITLLLIFSNPYTKMIDIRFTIKNKVVFSMMLILLISAVFVSGGIIYYTINQYEQSRFDIMTDKIQSVLVEMEQRLSDFDDIHEVSPEYLNNLLINFSNVFYTDVNLYDLQGNLVATSRKEIFERKLTSRKINAIAYRELVLNKKARIVQKENIGELFYYSAYVPFMNSENQLLAYLNVPYFAKETPLRQELMRVSVAVINIYALLILFSILIAVYLSNRITQPLREVQQRIHDIGLEKTNQRVQYEGKDEIAELVFEYNRMLDELGKSAALLAKSERESAWREMARQVAHEIKNPLTPMKLSVQLLERSQRNNDPDFDERFAKVTQTLIEQIDSLSSIASAFSQFAKMPEARTELVDITERIRQSVHLFKESTHTKVVFDYSAQKSIIVWADNERMLQVFNNLIKNAIQSIPKNRDGKVVISIRQQRNRVVVEIRDNGMGIDPEMEKKLFQPNFTTKTSGTGLGLAIVKNIVEEAEGAIWFQSKPGKGTSFFVSFPIQGIA